MKSVEGTPTTLSINFKKKIKDKYRFNPLSAKVVHARHDAGVSYSQNY